MKKNKQKTTYKYRRIDKMKTWEIAHYLVFQRGAFIPSFFTREAIHSLFGYEFDDNEWQELIDFCVTNDEHLWEYVEAKLDMWSARNEKDSFPDNEGWEFHPN